MSVYRAIGPLVVSSIAKLLNDNENNMKKPQ